MLTEVILAYNEMLMKLTYETGTATLIQFISMSLLNIGTGTHSVITTCQNDGGNCMSNLILSIIFYMLIVGWFGFVCALGYAAQFKRSKRLAQLLICVEGLIALVALMNIKLNLAETKDLLSLFTSSLDLLLALWVSFLAFRIIRSGGGRVVAGSRKRVRARQRTIKR